MQSDIYLIGCDPSVKHLAFAVYKNKTLTDYFKIKTDFTEINKLFFGFKNKNVIFGIEKQYLHLNIATLIKLVEVRTLVTTLASVNNFSEILTITPQEWQSLILGMNQKQKREQRKNVSMLVASKIACEKITDNDIADAICIANYIVINKFGYNQKLGGVV